MLRSYAGAELGILDQCLGCYGFPSDVIHGKWHQLYKRPHCFAFFIDDTTSWLSAQHQQPHTKAWLMITSSDLTAKSCPTTWWIFDGYKETYVESSAQLGPFCDLRFGTQKKEIWGHVSRRHKTQNFHDSSDHVTCQCKQRHFAHMRFRFWPSSTSRLPARMATGLTGISNLAPSAWLSRRHLHATFMMAEFLNLGIEMVAPKFLMVTVGPSWSFEPFFALCFFLGGSFDGSSKTNTSSLDGVMLHSFFFRLWCEILYFT